MLYYISLPVSSDYFISISNKMNTFLIRVHNIFGGRVKEGHQSGVAPSLDLVRQQSPFLLNWSSIIVSLNFLPSWNLPNTLIFYFPFEVHIYCYMLPLPSSPNLPFTFPLTDSSRQPRFQPCGQQLVHSLSLVSSSATQIISQTKSE